MTIKEDDIEEVKKKLRTCKKEDIIFNNLHFENMLLLREGSKEDVIKNVLNPSKLVYSYQEKGRKGDIIHNLHFKISNTRIMKLPVIFGKKGLYIITYIMRYRAWQNMIKKEVKRREKWKK